MKILKYFFATIIAITAFTACVDDDIYEDEDTPQTTTSNLVINEVVSTGDPDWVELYNTGDESIDLTGYSLKDSNTKWTISGVTIPAHGFVTFDCDGLDANGTTNFKISSGGESITLFNSTDEVIDEITTPDMSSNEGLSYGRETDGGDIWAVMTPTKASANSNENTPPIITADLLTEFTNLYEVSVSDADGIASVKLIYMVNDGVQSIDMALVEGQYKATLPEKTVGEVVKYYVVATDNTGLKSYYPEDGSNTPAEFTVVGGLEELTVAGAEDGYRGDVTFTAKPYYPNQVDEISLYYLLPGEAQDKTNDDKTKVVLTQNGDSYEGIVPEQNTGDIVSYYLRVEYIDGTKTYYPMEEEGSDFNHDLGTTWPNYTVEEITYDEVTEKTVNSTQGPLTSFTFPTNPVPDSDINVVLNYSSSVEITEARIYFAVGDNPSYEKDNKVKGEDEDSFTQTGVTINLKDVLTIDELSLSETGAKVSFYIRLQDADGYEYYYTNDGTMYIDESGAGGTTDESDTVKDDTSLWSTYLVQ